MSWILSSELIEPSKANGRPIKTGQLMLLCMPVDEWKVLNGLSSGFHVQARI